MMLPIKFLPIIQKNITRQPTRSLLTVLGVALAMFLFFTVDAMQRGVRVATKQSAADTTLIVYREDRFCPFTSQLPEDYERKIAAIPGVRSVVPMKVIVNNCRASLDVVTFRGVPPEALESDMFDDIRLISGSLEAWHQRGDAALVGRRLAERRGWDIGSQAAVGSIEVTIAGIFDSDKPQNENVAYTNLEFIQRAAGNQDGVVTQFNVLVEEPLLLDAVAKAIDSEFAHAQEPTATWVEKDFVARAVTDIIEIVNFAGWLGWGSLAAVFGLVGNAIALSVRERVRDHAILQTLGFSKWLIGRLIVAESLMLSLIGGLVGLVAGAALVHFGQFSFSVEGLSVSFDASVSSMAIGLVICIVIGIAAGLFPALQAARRETVESFRAV